MWYIVTFSTDPRLPVGDKRFWQIHNLRCDLQLAFSAANKTTVPPVTCEGQLRTLMASTKSPNRTICFGQLLWSTFPGTYFCLGTAHQYTEQLNLPQKRSKAGLILF